MGTRQIESGRVQANGAELYYESVGSGPLLVLIHGGSGSIEPFQGCTPVLAEHFTVVSYVRRGFAGSPVVWSIFKSVAPSSKARTTTE